jgi:predicted small secreted protein
MVKKSLIQLSLLLAAAGLAACNGNGGNTIPGTAGGCGSAPDNMQVLYPAPNASNVGRSVSGVYVATNGALPSGNADDFIASQSNGTKANTGAFVEYAGTIPSPHVSPPAGYTVYLASFAAPVGSGQTVKLLWNAGGTGCNPNAVVSTFTTK